MNELVTALVIGMAFGWALERAGLGDPSKLAGQFYLRDFTVVKVMMSAVLTMMIGGFWLGRLGLVDFGNFYVPDTYLLPQLIGGLVFGAGFVLSGLCPGTSCVALASGRRVGAVTMAGLLAGVALTGLAFPAIEDFYGATALGPLTLPMLTGLPYGFVVAVVTAISLAALVWIARREARS